MNKERLLKLAEYLRTVKQEEFNMAVWKCGATACAIGHACDIPEVREAGLYLRSSTLGVAVPAYNDKQNFYAVAAFFNISNENAQFLFSDYMYSGNVSPSEVADRICDFVAGG